MSLIKWSRVLTLSRHSCFSRSKEKNKQFARNSLNSRQIYTLFYLIDWLFSLSFTFSFSLEFYVPQRVIMAIMCFFAIAIAYVMRVCLSVAITQMVKPTVQNLTEIKSKTEVISYCVADPVSNKTSSAAVNLLNYSIQFNCGFLRII